MGESPAVTKNSRNRIVIAGLTLAILAVAVIAAGYIILALKTQPAAPAGRSGLPLLTEFGDFQCPHCARFAMIALPALEHDFIRAGLIRFEYRHYPFLGPESTMAAEAAECARNQEKFREYHDRLFEMSAGRQPYTPENLAQAARSAELREEQFRICTGQRLTRGRVLSDREYGRNLGVRGTPALFLDGQELSWRDYPDLREQIQAVIERRQGAAADQTQDR